MKNNFLKNGKSALSLVVAFAVIAVSLFAAVPGINLGANAATVEDTWDGTTVTPTETDADGNIIIKTAEELAWLALASTPDETKDKNYKVVDNAVFNLGGMTGVTLTSTAGDVSTATVTSNNWANDTKGFAGNFDGNGVVIYNMYSSGAYNGLFPHLTTDNTAKTVSISNVTIKASYIKGYHFSGAVVGQANAGGTGQYLNFTGCKVENCYINATSSNAACNRTGGLLVGTVTHNKTTVKNCIAVDNVVAATDIKGGFIGNTSAYAGNASISGSVAIGNLPYSTLVEGSTKTLQTKSTDPACYSDVYTDQEADAKYTGVTTVATDNMKGAAAKVNMPNLDWSVLIAFDGEYPDLRASHTLSISAGDASGHKVVCSDHENESMTESHNLVENAIGTEKTCACGYSEAITEKKTVKWTISFAMDTEEEFLASVAAGTGKADDPYIITTAEQLAYVTCFAGANSAGKHYKVANNIGAFDMTSFGKDLTAAEVETAYQASTWQGKWYNNANNYPFQGTFDGNGVVIYGVDGKSWQTGLFPNVQGATIKNLTIQASRFNTTGGAGAGAIVGKSAGITIENCAVKNCYITTTKTESKGALGIIVGTVGNTSNVIINNCLVVNNIVSQSDNYPYGGLTSGAYAQASQFKFSNIVAIGNNPVPVVDHVAAAAFKNVATASCYSNVYTTENVSESTYAPEQIKTLAIADMSGTAGLENMTLDFAKVWFANEGTPELQVFHTLKGVADGVDAYAGHTANCEDCGLEGVGLSDHVYDNAYTCEICEFTCDHQNGDYITPSAENTGDCVTDPYIENTCACGRSWKETTGTASGHTLTKTDAKAATCAKDGNVEYWTCSTCGKIFLSDDKMAAMDTAVTAEDVVLSATGAHVELTDDEGNLVYLMDENSHSTYCKVCQTKITTTAHDGEFEKDENGHTGKCTVCKYETEKNAAHTFGDDNACDICTWTCTEHVVKAGDVEVEGDCVTDKVTAQYCDRCKISLDDKVESAKGHTLVKTAENAATCTKEGNKVYWTCSTCNKIFLSDDKMAAMDTAVSAEDTVIAKLPHDYVEGKPVYKYDEAAHWFECKDCGKAEYTEHTLETDTDCEGVYQWCEDADGNSCGYETFDYTYSSDDGSATVVADTNAFTKDVVTDLIQITTETSDYAELEEIFKAAGHTKFTAYEFSPSEEMAEGGKATITITVPDIYGKSAAIYYVDTESGKIEKLDTKIEELENEDEEIVITASAEITKIGVFAVAADEVVAGGNDSDNDNNVNNNNANNGNNNQTNNGSVNNGGDTSNTSPATASETVAAVAAVATLSAAAIVLARKFKKA